MVVNQLIWVLGTELGLSARVVSTLNCLSIFQPQEQTVECVAH